MKERVRTGQKYRFEPETARQVVLTKLCGVPRETIWEHFGVTNMVVEHSLRRRSKHWGDPLVENYRGAAKRIGLGVTQGYGRNAAHLVLSYLGHTDIEPTGLVNPRHDRQAYDLVRRVMLDEPTKRVVDTSIASVHLPNRGFLPPYVVEEFGCGMITSPELVDRLVMDELVARYNPDKGMDFSEVYLAVSSALVDRLGMDPPGKWRTNHGETLITHEAEGLQGVLLTELEVNIRTTTKLGRRCIRTVTDVRDIPRRVLLSKKYGLSANRVDELFAAIEAHDASQEE